VEREWIVRLPRGAQPPYRVFINGVEQREGEDFVISARALRFSRPLEKEGRIGFWRWAAMFFGVFGTYRKNDSVDLQYMVRGQQKLATGLDIELTGPARRHSEAGDVGRQHRNR
jgi:hypothetical protein